jgi:response regulator of citrate/malate metabolism
LFYVWGDVLSFSDVDEATAQCLDRDNDLAVFVVDVFLGEKSGFYFLDSIADKFPMVYDDTVIITGHASNEVVDVCLASGINHLLEKPIRSYALEFAIRSIVMKYVTFAKKLLQDPEFAEDVNKI